MQRATRVLPAGTWELSQSVDAVSLDYDARHRRRIAMRGQAGLEFLLDLPEALLLRDGDGLALEAGAVVTVKAAPEALMEVRAGTGLSLAAIAWHLGNRHLPTQVLAESLRIREDHVIRDLLIKLGADVTAVKAPFDPEGGAYGGHYHD